MLDPWAEDPTLPLMKMESASQVVHVEGDEVVVSVRSRPTGPRFTEDEEGVVTSAAPIETTLRRSAVADPKPTDHATEAAQGAAPKPASSSTPPPKPSPVSSTQSASGAPPPRPTPLVVAPPVPPAPATAPALSAGDAPRPAVVAASGGSPRPPIPSRPSQPFSEAPTTLASKHGAPPTLGSPSAVPSAAPSRPSPPSLRPVPPLEKAPVPAPAPSSVLPIAASDIEAVDAFADLPPELHERFAARARVVVLAPGESFADFGAALVLEGEADVSVEGASVPILRSGPNTLLPTQGTLKGRVPLRVVAGDASVRLATWEQGLIDDALHTCPWVLDEIKALADRLHAVSGVLRGPLGGLSQEARGRLLDSLTMRACEPNEEVVEVGQSEIGLVLVGAGFLEVARSSAASTLRTLEPGRGVFLRAAAAHEPALEAARAGHAGAIVFVGGDTSLKAIREDEGLWGALSAD